MTTIFSKVLRPYRTGPPPWESWQKYMRNIWIDPTAIIAPSSTVQFWHTPEDTTPRISIGELSHIFCIFNLLRSTSTITVGKRCQLGNANIVCAEKISIGDDVLMAWGINILDSNHHSLDWKDRCEDILSSRRDYLQGLPLGTSQSWNNVSKAEVNIASKCWIGCNVTILKGVTIGEGSVIGAGSVVVRDIPPWSIAGGNPAKVFSSIDENMRTVDTAPTPSAPNRH